MTFGGTGSGTDADSEPPLRLFTLAEANALLPSLIPILTRMRDNMQALVEAKLRLVGLSVQNGSGGVSDRAGLARKAEQLEAAIDEDLWMVRALGVELKSVDEGLVDFPTLRDDRVVYLCWRLGEGSITHWHEIDAGFAGRRPL